MAKIQVHLPSTPAKPYTILIDRELLSQSPAWLPENFEKIVIITDDNVRNLYGETLLQKLKSHGRDALLLSFPPGEAYKTRETKQILEDQMLSHACGRNTCCLALGGGVSGDMAGFIAATYMRGISLIQIPTTLLAMVDSSIGGKTAVDTPYGKNLIGAFWQPLTVIADTHCLLSLPQQQLVNGLFEVIKMALTHDKNLFEFIQKNLALCLSADLEILQYLIQQSVQIKATVVAEDELEQSGARSLLNFGHTIGHALEQVSDYQMLHGFAVGYGILMETKIAEIMGIISPPEFNIIANLLAQLGIAGRNLSAYSPEQMILKTKLDKKNYSGKVRYVLLKTIGEAYINDNEYVHPVTDKLVKQAWQDLTH